MRDPAVVAEGLRKEFGPVLAVSEVSFSVAPGEIFALLGPDGAGKTTSLRMLAGVVAPTVGRALVEGIDVTRQPEAVRSRVGYMPQRFSLYGDLSVRENLVLSAELFQVPPREARERIRALLAASGLAGVEDRATDYLSGGMKQKLALACTLVHEPAVLLLDEPTAGVDPVSRREFWRILYRLARAGTAIVVSTTYMDEADRCTTVGLIYRGRLIAAGDPRALRSRMRGEVIDLAAEPRGLARQVLKQSPEVRAETLLGNRIRAVVQDAARAVPVLTARLADRGVRVLDLRPVPPSLEDVFVSLIEEEAARREETGG